MILFYGLLFLAITVILLAKIFQNQIIGRIGEKYTAQRIKLITGGTIFQDVYINGSHGVQQIDIVAVTEKGILVIEKKTYIGLIVGGNYDKQWTIYTAKGKKKFSMMNPHHQNFGHIKALCENIPQAEGKCIDMVIFGNNAKLGDRIPAGTIRDADFRNFYVSLPHRLSETEMDSLAKMISNLDRNRTQNKKLHKQKIKGRR